MEGERESSRKTKHGRNNDLKQREQWIDKRWREGRGRELTAATGTLE
jgi:hypothetical protein